MKILAIETSCDDTGVAVLEIRNSKLEIRSNVVSSQPIHSSYGGVFPIMAKREHQANLVPVLTSTLKEAGLLNVLKTDKSPRGIDGDLPVFKTEVIKKILEKESGLYEFTKTFLETHQKPKIDAIAVTHGPGLEPCLWVGVNFAKALSYAWDIPVIPVNHIEAHILVNFMEHGAHSMKQMFPAISLIVSGGHTQLILVKKIGKYEIIGETRDDAAGECFDKAARILGLGYPGGPIISKLASGGRTPANLITLPRPMMHTKDYDFSFSGLKTSVLYKLRDTDPKIAKSEKFIQEMCFAVQDAICDVLVKKTLNAAKDYKAKTIILGGGVSANQELKKQFTEKSQVPVIFPEPKLSTDNALMIAVAAYFNLKQPSPKLRLAKAKKIGWQRLSVHPNLRV